MNKSHFLTSAGAFAFAVTMLAAGSSHADFIQEVGASCVPTNNTGWAVSNGRLATYYNTAVTAHCPFPSQTGIRHDSVTFLSVDVKDGDTTGVVSAKACWQDYNSGSFGCGSSDATSYAGTAYDSLFPSTSTWSTHGSDYAFVSVSLPDGTNSYIHGYYAAN